MYCRLFNLVKIIPIQEINCCWIQDHQMINNNETKEFLQISLEN
jgi:hypothetical protein